MKGLSPGRLLFNKLKLANVHDQMSIMYVVVFLFFGSILSAQPEGYYSSATGKSGEELQQALHEIIDGHTVLTYSALWSAVQTTDKKADGTVWDMYSDIPGGTPPYTYTFVSDQCGNYSGEGSCYNREHSFPRSWFADASPMFTDLFHIYPTDGYVNGQRGNYPFGETDTPQWTSQNGSKRGPCSVNGYTGIVFEPIDEYKGDFARTYFYMAVRYFNEDSGWPGSPMVDGAQLKPWAKEMMVQWHSDDPVSEKETGRNNAVYALQGNRNPFIDHPEFVNLMYEGERFDELPPDIDSISIVSSTSMVLWFNEPLDSISATTVSHYSITGSTSVVSATYAGHDNHAVELEVAELQNGSYGLTITGVADTTGNTLQLAMFPFQVVTLQTEVPAFATDLKIYPNPGSETFYLDMAEIGAQVTGLKLLDTSGRSVSFTYSISQDQIELTTKAVAGVYYLLIKHKQGTQRSAPLLIR
jgi:endonuclease I